MATMLRVEDAGRWLKTGAPPYDDPLFREMGRASFQSVYADHLAREAWVSGISYAIPCREAIDLLAKRPLLEIGAGTGYWAALIREAGGDVIATDSEACGTRNGYGNLVGCYHETLRMSGAKAVSAHPDRDVLCVWPGYMARWPAMAFQRMAVGRTLHLVGEGAGGATGSDHMHEIVHREFTEPHHTAIPCWRGIHDILTTATRRTHG